MRVVDLCGELQRLFDAACESAEEERGGVAPLLQGSSFPNTTPVQQVAQLQHQEEDNSSSSSSSSSDNSSTLPADVVARVVSSLPLHLRAQCRSVCRDWNIPSFFAAAAGELSTLLPSILCCNSDRKLWNLYDPHSNRWFALTPPLTPQLLSPRSAYGAFVCIGGAGGGAPLMVCNPLSSSSSSSCRSLPPTPPVSPRPYHRYRPPPGRYWVAQIVPSELGSSSSSYRVLVVEMGTSFIFDSARNSWEAIGAQPWPMAAEDDYRSVYCNASVYALGKTTRLCWRFDMRHKCWTSLPGLHAVTRNESLLVECQGGVFAVGNICSSLLKTFYVLHFDTVSHRWVQIATVPRELRKCLEFPQSYHFLGSKDIVLILASENSPLHPRSPHTAPYFCVLAYDLRDRSWHAMAPSALKHLQLSYPFSHPASVSFHPRLGAAVV